MMTDPKTFTPAELLLHATEFQWDALTISASVEDPSSAGTVAPKIHGWQVIDMAAGVYIRTDGGWDSGPEFDLCDPNAGVGLDVDSPEPLPDPDELDEKDRLSSEAYIFATLEDAFAAAAAYRDEQARRGL